jgi:hypothetical protein
MVNNDLLRKGAIYGGNYLAGTLGRYMGWYVQGPVGDLAAKALDSTLNVQSSIANPIGAMVYGSFDVLRNSFPNLKNSIAVRAIDGLATLYYSASVFADLYSWYNGNWDALKALPFDATMAFESGKNLREDFI